MVAASSNFTIKNTTTVVKEGFNGKGSPNYVNARTANQNFKGVTSDSLKSRQVESKTVDRTYINLLVEGNVLSSEHGEIIKQNSNLALRAKQLYLLLAESFQEGKFDPHSALGTDGKNITRLSDVLSINKIASLLSTAETVTAFSQNMPIMIEASDSQWNWEQALHALQQKPVNGLISLGFKSTKTLIELANLTQGLPILETIEKYMTEVVKKSGDILGIQHMPIHDLIKMFNPNNWESLKSTLMNKSIQGYLNKGKIGVHLILTLAGSADRANILNGMDTLIERTKDALDLDLDNLSFEQIKNFFTAEIPTEQKAQFVLEGITRAVDLSRAIYRFLDQLDGKEDGQVNCCQCTIL